MFSQQYTPGQLVWYVSPIHEELQKLRQENPDVDDMDNHLFVVLSNGWAHGHVMGCMCTSNTNAAGFSITIPRLSSMDQSMETIICPYRVFTVFPQNLDKTIGFVPPNLLAQIQEAVKFHMNLSTEVPSYLQTEAYARNMEIKINSDAVSYLRARKPTELERSLKNERALRFMENDKKKPETAAEEKPAPREFIMPSENTQVKESDKETKTKNDESSINAGRDFIVNNASRKLHDVYQKISSKKELLDIASGNYTFAALREKYDISMYYARGLRDLAINVAKADKKFLMEGLGNGSLNIKFLPEDIAYALVLFRDTDLTKLKLTKPTYRKYCQSYGYSDYV